MSTTDWAWCKPVQVLPLWKYFHNGKTSSAKQVAQTVFELDVSEPSRVLATHKESLAAVDGLPILIDEWSRAPQSWDVVRRIVDEDERPGHFILTGSASKDNLNIHSGAGRIAQLLMRPLSMEERGLCQPCVRLSELLEGSVDKSIFEHCPVTISDYVHEIYSSGFPGIHRLSDSLVKVQINGYIEDIIHKEFPEQGLKVRKPQILRSWLKAYAAATGSTTSYTKLLIASTPGEDIQPAASTTLVYRNLLDALYITDRIEAWLPTDNHFSALGKSPKHYLVDPALAVRLLGLSYSSLISDNKKPLGKQKETSMLGRLFENLVASSLKTYCQSNDAELYHLRTPAGDHEVDFIIVKGNRILGIEVKLAHEVSRDDVKHLDWLSSKLDAANRVTKVIINTGEYAYQRADGVVVIPLALLGA
ncbi:MAG: DUF4143 domain-containing protein [Coriobacteriales bacterium]|nr:DUF4143 domain-containing protein [Coriobacteriales bacterium]